MSDGCWTTLREFAENWVDEIIRDETDAEVRAALIANYDAITVKAEAFMKRDLAQQVAAYEARLH